MAKKSNIQKNWPKYLLQWGTLAAIAAFLIDTLPSTHLFGKEIWADEVWEFHQILLGIALLAAFTLFGKLFCGYICPLGTAQDLMIRLRNLLKIKSIKIRNGSIADKVLRIFKYGLLFLIVYLATDILDLKQDLAIQVSIASAILLLLGCFVIDMFWCRYLCPVGAILNSMKFWTWIVVLIAAWYATDALGADIPWSYFLGTFCAVGYLVEILNGRPSMEVIHVTKDEVPCNNCGVCVKVCPYHIDLRSFHNGKINHVDCTLCGECIASCHTGALNVGTSKPNKNRIWNLLPPVLAIALMAFAFWIGGLL